LKEIERSILHRIVSSAAVENAMIVRLTTLRVRCDSNETRAREARESDMSQPLRAIRAILTSVQYRVSSFLQGEARQLLQPSPTSSPGLYPTPLRSPSLISSLSLTQKGLQKQVKKTPPSPAHLSASLVPPSGQFKSKESLTVPLGLETAFF